MNSILQLITYIITNHGYGAAIVFIIVSTVPLLSFVYLSVSKSSIGKVIDQKFSEKIEEDKSKHRHGNRVRKEFTVDVQEILEHLAESTNSNRAVLFEFSNGTTNLIGLPFLFMTATAEVASPGLPLMASGHQKLNTSVIAKFLIKLEREGSIFIDNSESVPQEFKILKQIMEKANIGSALFYSIQGVEEAIGFLVLVTSRSSYNIIDVPKVLPQIGKAAQKIGSMINFDEISKNEKEKNKWK